MLQDGVAISNHKQRLTSVTADLSFIPKDCTDIPVHYTFQPLDGEAWESIDYENYSVQIQDSRGMLLSLQANGFELIEAPSRVETFEDREAIRRIYFPEIVELVKQMTGGREVLVFDHLLRQRTPDQGPLNFGRRSKSSKAAPANGRVHNDYTTSSGADRVRAVLNRFGLKEEPRRYSIVNVWRAVSEPVIDAPLALCDSRSISALDLVDARVIYPDRTGSIYTLKRSNQQRWHYFSDMRQSEVIVFKQFDTDLSEGSRFTPHSAFENPLDVENQRPRKSIEVRCLVIH